MKRTTRRRSGAAVVTALMVCFGLAACGGGADTSFSEQPDGRSGGDANAQGAGAQTFGDGCSAIPTGGEGSFNGMITDPVTTAASHNPLLKTLVSAVWQVDGLADMLNAAAELTVFAPTDEAFAKIPEADLNAVLADETALAALLSHHVVGEELDPEAVVGEHDTLNGDTVTVDGDPEAGMTVDGGTAEVICGNIATSNATVYVIDAVLNGDATIPPSATNGED